MHKEVVPVIPLVGQFKLPERDVADCHVKKAVRKLRFLIPLHGNRGVLVKLPRNPARYAVNLHPVYFAV